MTLGAIVLFTVTFCHLHDNVFERGCEAISGKKCKIARNCLTSTFKYIVMQMTKGNCEKGYCADLAFVVGVVPFVVVVVFFLIYITVYCILLQ